MSAGAALHENQAPRRSHARPMRLLVVRSWCLPNLMTKSRFSQGLVMPINLNRANLSIEPINRVVNDMIERAAATVAELPRPYLGASIVGHECLRRIQFDWWCKPELAARTREIFDRGHYFEERTRQHLIRAGFRFAPPEALAFAAADGALRGHAD